MGKSSSPEVSYQSSPEQAALLRAIMPLVQGIANYGVGNLNASGVSSGTPAGSYANPVAPSSNPYQIPTTNGTGTFANGWSPNSYGGGQDMVWSGGQQYIMKDGVPTPTGVSAGYYAGSSGRSSGAPQTTAQSPNPSGETYSGVTGGVMGGLSPSSSATITGGYEPGPTGLPLNAPAAPYMPSMEGVLSGVGLPNAQGLYSGLNAPQPTAGWYDSLSPQVMQGLWEPYNEGGRQLMEVMGGAGRLGSESGGISGNAAAGLGQFYQDASKDVGLQAWQMASPGMWGDYQSGINERNLGWDVGLQDWQNQMTERTSDWQNEAARRSGDYQMSQQAWNVPWGLMGMAPSLTPTGFVQPQSGSGIGSGLMGGGAGWALGSSLGLSNPATAGLAGLFGLGGLLGGK